MGTSNQALLRLADDVNWWTMCPELRALHIAVGGSERAVAIEVAARAEFNAYNHSPFFVLEDAHTKSDPGWVARAERMRTVHEQRRQEMAKEGYHLPALAPPLQGDHPLAMFGGQISQCLAAQASVSELNGLVIVLAPSALDEPEAFAESVRFVMQVVPSLRVVVIELGMTSRDYLLAGLNGAGMHSQCIVDPEQRRREQVDRLAAIAAAPPGASPQMRVGGAGPRDRIAPPRAGRPPRDAPVPPEALEMINRELGPAAALLGESGALLERRIVGAALALQEQRFADAVHLQSQACDQCWTAGLFRIGCLLEVALAVYYLQAGDVDAAHRAFDVAARRAEGAAVYDVAVQALFGLAALFDLREQLETEVRCYMQAGQLAERVLMAVPPVAAEERAKMTMLAIQAYHMAGRVAVRANAHDAALGAWDRAVTIAAHSDPELAAASSAPDIARAMAELKQERHQTAEAAALYARADALEHPPATANESTPVHSSVPSNAG